MPRYDFPPGKVFAIQGRVNGLELRLIFDTGADHVCLTRGIFELLGSQPSESSTRLIAADSSSAGAERPIYILNTVEAFGVTAHDVEAVEITLPRGVGFHGVLGVSFLKHFRFTADYGEGWIEIYGRTQA